MYLKTLKRTKRVKKVKLGKGKTKRVTKRITKKLKGGNQEPSCLDANRKCDTLDTHYTDKVKVNESWKTCITKNGVYNHIIYITPKNVVIKSIETQQIPEFVVKLPSEEGHLNCKLRFQSKNKYIACFLNICNEWYAMMRLFGSTLNTGFFASHKSHGTFQKIHHIHIDFHPKNPKEGSGLIHIPENYYEKVNETKLMSTSSSPTIYLKDECFSDVTDERILNVLKAFRNQKLFANIEKRDAAGDVFGLVLDGVKIAAGVR
jgi:pectate lyase